MNASVVSDVQCSDFSSVLGLPQVRLSVTVTRLDLVRH